MITKNVLMTAEDTIWLNFLYETLLRACSGFFISHAVAIL